MTLHSRLDALARRRPWLGSLPFALAIGAVWGWISLVLGLPDAGAAQASGAAVLAYVVLLGMYFNAGQQERMRAFLQREDDRARAARGGELPPRHPDAWP